ncbi:hypothetical protein MBCUT_09100 [Methanobrevibacter cuticularis]|uniref:Right handed beta helix domain-containing protein n=2 Tax=Methanobrevibacter cuticularis TaxID=47311 RepID=A0A166E7F9_9EURY|nr:hypothetical protein MBCUT_09100 [Methanobrevibacter cuticularis]
MQGTNTGTVFTITAPNVRIVNLNISRYSLAINSNQGNLSVIGCNISTIDRSIHLSGASLTGVLLENNTIISSVSNVNYGAVYVSATYGSVVNIAVKGNNITSNGTSISIGVRFNVFRCNNTLFFDNNNITAIYSVYLSAFTNNNTITITNNNIKGTSNYGFYLDAYTSNNTITITNNNITGPYGVLLDVYTNSNNTITITNNNITGTSTYGFYLDVYTSNNTITITNNNIKGTSNYGFYLRTYTSNNTITITNNNITATSYSCVYLYAYTSNNTITITNNNITGTSTYGFYLYAHTFSNNTITITNNNITGTSNYGFYLRADTSNNNNINFTDNNIRGVSYGMYINCNNAEFSGLSVVNNTLNATNSSGIGIGFVNLNPTALSDILVSGNNIFAGTTSGTGINFAAGLTSVNNVTINYNRVLANTGLNISTTFSGSVDANLNWWGNNTPILPTWINNYYIVSIIKLNGEDYYILSLNGSSLVNSTIVVNSSSVQVGENVLISGQLDFDLVGADASLLPYFEMIISNSSGNTTYDARIPKKVNNIYDSIIVDNQTLTNSIGLIFDIIVDGNKQSNINLSDANAIWSTEYTTNRTGNITAEINSTGNSIFQQFRNTTTFTVNTVNKNSTNSTIVISPNPAQIGENITINGQLANYTGVTQVNVTVDGTIFTNVSVNNGYWELNYTTNRTGTDLEIVVSFAEDNNYDAFNNSTTFTVAKNSTNSTIIVNPNPAQIGENITISGQLANYTGITSVNVTVDGKLFTDVAVDVSGYWELNYTTNRTGTDLEVIVSFAGDGNYDAFSNSTTFIVNKNNTNSTIVVGNVQIGENVTVSGHLANYTGINSVDVTVDGTLFTVLVDGFGDWSLNYTTNRTGNLTVVVSFVGNENYTSFTNSTNFNVTKLAINSTINIPSNVKVGKTITIDGVLVDENGNPIANAPINVTVDGKVYTLTTDSNGRWSLTYKPTQTGSIDIAVDYTGNDEYSNYTNTTAFNVVKGEAIVDIDVVKNPDGSVDVIVTVTDEDGDPIPNYKVNVELDGKNIGNIVTDVLGVGKIHIPSSKLSDGKHVITVSSDDVNYNVNPVSAEFETQNNNNDTNNTNKTSDNPVATATMKNTGIPIIAIILVLLTILGITIRRKQN